MRYRVTGANRETGKPVDIMVDAPSAEQAEAQASESGALVSEVRLAEPQPAATPATMSRGQFLVLASLLACVAVLLGVIAWQQAEAQRQARALAQETSSVRVVAPVPPPKWDYMIVSPDDEKFDGEMDLIGALGWELVAARRATSADEDGKPSYEMILKRALPPDPERDANMDKLAQMIKEHETRARAARGE